MIKNLLAAFLFLMSSALLSQELSITNNLPASATGGIGLQTDFTLTKGANMGSFAKFQVDVPAGFTVESVEIKGGNFTFENNRAKIVWVSLPSENSFTFTLRITAPANTSGSITLTPQFFYLENNVKKDYTPTPATVSYSAGSAAAAVTPPSNPSSTSVPSAPAVTSDDSPSATSESAKTVEVASTPPPAQPTSATPPASATPSAAKEASNSNAAASSNKSNAVYHVQVYALSIKPNKAKFAEYGTIKIVEENGLYKVLVGQFKTLEEAKKYKAGLLSKGVSDCFIVSYENGVRTKL
ncbi:MAG: SPOR domain-containing protein [Bacteroidetes bacterium]|nr:SPOR domain-containing protein [Bacteroidota bacterium]